MTPQLRMKRDDLLGLPALDLPAGYRLERATAEQAPEVGACAGAAFGEPWGEEWARKTLFEDPTVDSVLVIRAEDGQIAATATARSIPDRPEVGYVHFVGTRPEHTGRALGYLATLAVLHEFVRLGKTSAVLDTDDHRTAAIKTYRRLGFEPWMTDPSHPDRWAAIA